MRSIYVIAVKSLTALLLILTMLIPFTPGAFPLRTTAETEMNCDEAHNGAVGTFEVLPTGETVLEAEDGKHFWPSVPNYVVGPYPGGVGSNGTGFVAGFYSNPGAYIEFPISVRTPGRYTLTVCYANGGGSYPEFGIYVDGRLADKSAYDPVGTWNDWGIRETEIKLSDGEHTLRFVAEPGIVDAINVDYLLLTPALLMNSDQEHNDAVSTFIIVPEGETILEAEEGKHFWPEEPNYVVGPYPGGIGSNGSGFVAGFYCNPDAYVEYPINVERTGKYTVRVCYANGEDGSPRFGIYLDESPIDKHDYAPVGSWSDWDLYEFEILVSAGAHSLKFVAEPGIVDAINLDYISFELITDMNCDETHNSTVPTFIIAAEGTSVLEAEDGKHFWPFIPNWTVGPYPGGVGSNGSGFVAGFYSNPGAYIEYPVIVLNSGKYTVNVCYANGGNAFPVFYIDVDGRQVDEHTYAPVGGWGDWGLYECELTLTAGNHTIRFVAGEDITDAANIDYLSFTRATSYDLDRSGTVTISDVTALLDHLAIAVEYDAKYDLDYDDAVTISDVTHLLDYLSEKPVSIAEVQYLNSDTPEINSQIKLGGNSSIEWNYRQQKEFTSFASNDGNLRLLSYPRIKKLSNGDLIMIFQEGQVSGSVYMTRSTDNGKTWGRALTLRAGHWSAEYNDTLLYATGELLELQNGDLLFACSVRALNGYQSNIGDGIEVMISKDKGYTWGEPKVVYNGGNWEPSIIQLPTGEIQLYFTQQAPYFEKGMFNSVDVGLIRSYDSGETWSGPLEGEEYRVETLSRHEHEDSDGLKSCDGMAVAVVLNEGKGIVYACESVESAPQKVSIVYTDMQHNWVYSDFTPNQYGPDGRRWYASGNMRGFAPYLIQAISGETILSFNTDDASVRGMQVGIGNEEAQNFSGFGSPFGQIAGSYWGSLCFKNSHTVIATAMLETGGNASGEAYKSILYSEGQLNHTIEARMQSITIDGKNGDWLDDSVLFVGSDSQAQATARFSYDDEYLYILVERLDDDLVTNSGIAVLNDSIDVMINTGSVDKTRIDEDVYKFNLSLLGLTNFSCGTSRGSYKRTEIEGAETAFATLGTLNDHSDTDTGYALEAKIPWSALGGKPENGRITVSCTLYNNDGQGVVMDAMTGSSPQNWISVIVA